MHITHAEYKYVVIQNISLLRKKKTFIFVMDRLQMSKLVDDKNIAH